MSEPNYKFLLHTTSIITLMLASPLAHSQNLPSSADPSRISPTEQETRIQKPDAPIIIPDIQKNIQTPDIASEITFKLNNVIIENSTIFDAKDFIDIYQPYIGQELPLNILWVMAGQITERYRSKGYFLSRAYIPAQEIDNGIIKIKIVEGSIGKVISDDEKIPLDTPLLQKHIEKLISQKPLRSTQLENFILRINDLPGLNARAILQAFPEGNQGEVKLSLSQNKEEDNKVTITANNYGSRFLGPYQATTTYTDSFIPLQETTFIGSTSLPLKEMNYAEIQHIIPIEPGWTIDASGSYTQAEPGASLKQNEIKSNSSSFKLDLNWTPIRQRQENLTLSLGLHSKNTNSDILSNTPLTRDRIRSAQLSLQYDTNDTWNGYNYITAEIEQGLDALGASKKGDTNLSRGEATPSSTTIRASYIRLQSITNNTLLIAQTSGQATTDPLFSAQEFGYGGPSFGRAYDSSEITGDQGIAASLEIRRQSLSPIYNTQITPYGFYDIGKVWNKDNGSKPVSAASAGFGAYLNHETGLSANLGIAWPLTKQIDTPLYGGEDSPRILFQTSFSL